MERASYIRRRRPGQRRTRHPMSLPGSGHASESAGAAVRRGPQHALCQRTACCVCFALWWRRVHGERDGEGRVTVPDWTQLPALDDHAFDNDSHHEPEGIHAEDGKTVPLCPPHHTGGFYARHAVGPRRFWGYFRITSDDVIAEMQRRVALLTEART